jgi:hypothetical protein
MMGELCAGIMCLEKFLITLNQKCIPHENANKGKIDVGDFHEITFGKPTTMKNTRRATMSQHLFLII